MFSLRSFLFFLGTGFLSTFCPTEVFSLEEASALPPSLQRYSPSLPLFSPSFSITDSFYQKKNPLLTLKRVLSADKDPVFCELSAHEEGIRLSLRDTLTGSPLKNIPWQATIRFLDSKENTPLAVLSPLVSSETLSLNGSTDHTGRSLLKLPALFKKKAHLIDLSFSSDKKTFTGQKLFLPRQTQENLEEKTNSKALPPPKPESASSSTKADAHTEKGPYFLSLLDGKTSFLWAQDIELTFLARNFSGAPLSQGMLTVQLSSPSTTLKLEQTSFSLPLNVQGQATLKLPLPPLSKQQQKEACMLHLKLTLPPPANAPALGSSSENFVLSLSPMELRPELRFSKNWALLSEPFRGEVSLQASPSSSTPFQGEISLYKIAFQEDATTLETKVYSAPLQTNTQGNGQFNVLAPEPGFFRCEVKFATPQARTPFCQTSAFFYALGSPEQNAQLALPKDILKLIPEKSSYKEGEAPRFLVVSSPVFSTALLSLHLGQKEEKNASFPLTPPFSVLEYPFSLSSSSSKEKVRATLSSVAKGQGLQAEQKLTLAPSTRAFEWDKGNLSPSSFPDNATLFSAEGTPLPPLNKEAATLPDKAPASSSTLSVFSLQLRPEMTSEKESALSELAVTLTLRPLSAAPPNLPILSEKLFKNPFLPPPAPWQKTFLLKKTTGFTMELPPSLAAGLYELTLEATKPSALSDSHTPPFAPKTFYLAIAPALQLELSSPALKEKNTSCPEAPLLLQAELSSLLKEEQALSYSLYTSPSVELLSPSEGTLTLKEGESLALPLFWRHQNLSEDAYFCLTIWGNNAQTLCQKELTLPAEKSPLISTDSTESADNPTSLNTTHLTPEIDPTGEEAFDLAWRLSLGWGQHNRPSALYWLKKAQKDYPPALFIAAQELLLEEKNSPEGLQRAQEALQKLSKNPSCNDPQNWLALGTLGLSPLFDSLESPLRPSPEQSLAFLQKAEHLLEKASEEGSLYAAYKRGLLYEEGGSLRCPEKALFYYQKAAQKGYPPALYLLGKNKVQKKHYSKALPLLEQAYQSDFIPAGELLAQSLWQLSLLKKEDRASLQQKALFYLQETAQKGAPLAAQALSALYAEGQHFPKDEEKAAFWLQKAQKENPHLPALEDNPILKVFNAENTPRFTLPLALSLASLPLPKKFPQIGQGLEHLTLKELLDEWEKKTPQALTELLHRYARASQKDAEAHAPSSPRQTAAQDVHKALKLHKKALSGDTTATYELILLLQDSDFEEDKALAEAWLELLAQSQHEKALLLLASQLAQEQPQKALALYESLAERHSQEAQLALIEIFEHTGNGAPLNFPRAKAYKAQLEEDIPRKKLLELLKQELSSTTKPSEELLTLLSLLADNKSFSPSLQKEFQSLAESYLSPKAAPVSQGSRKKSHKNT